MNRKESNLYHYASYVGVFSCSIITLIIFSIYYSIRGSINYNFVVAYFGTISVISLIIVLIFARRISQNTRGKNNG